MVIHLILGIQTSWVNKSILNQDEHGLMTTDHGLICQLFHPPIFLGGQLYPQLPTQPMEVKPPSDFLGNIWAAAKNAPGRRVNWRHTIVAPTTIQKSPLARLSQAETKRTPKTQAQYLYHHRCHG